MNGSKINGHFSKREMISAIMILDRTGDILIIHKYRNDFDMVAIDNYRIGVIATKDIVSPCVLLDETSFLHTQENDLFYVGVTRQNANTSLIFEFLSRLPCIFRSVLDLKEITINEIKKYTPEIIELLDVMIHQGYPQNTDPEALRLLTQRQSGTNTAVAPDNQVTVMATGSISWRAPNIYYKTNELYVDVIEKVSLTQSASGEVLNSSVNGYIIMKALLSGMPECKIGFNEKVGLDPEKPGVPGARSGSSIEIDDMVFHQCVKLTNFAKERAISFTPPDGEFELMRYRKTENVGVPFQISPLVKELPQNKLVIRIGIRASYDQSLIANPLIINIPLPQNTAEVEVSSTTGKGKYAPEHNMIVWKSTNFPGKTQAEIHINVKCLAATSKASPATKLTNPISAEFNIPMFSASGLALQYLKIIEKSGYAPEKWLRYATKGGKYEVAMI